MSNVLILDTSRHNGFVDVAKAKSRGVKGIKVRVSVGDYYTDPRFRETRDNCYKYDMPVGGYHVVRPDIDPLSQLARLYESLDGDFMTMPFTFDCEVIGRMLWHNTVTMAVHLDRQDTFEPEIYTAQWVTVRQPLGAEKAAITSFPLHVANYTIRARPAMPEGWLNWVFWQYSADGNRLGAYYGVDSQDVDLNRFNGTLENYQDYIGVEPDPTPEMVCFPADMTLGYLYNRAWSSYEAD